MAFTETLHPRGTGAVGGQFVAAGASKSQPAKKAAAAGAGGRPVPRTVHASGKGNLSFDGKRGAGYGKAGGDSRVKSLQAALNKLGFTDGAGKALKGDGKLGPKTTAAVKKAQRALGIKPDGVVTPALLAKLSSAKSAKDLKKAPAKKAAPVAKKAAPAKPKKAAAVKPAPKAKLSKPVAKKAAPVVVKRGAIDAQ